MSQPLLIKVYGNFWAAQPDLARELTLVAAQAFPVAQHAIDLTKDLLTISFEGVFFPVEETVAVLKGHQKPESLGRLDVIDLENWRLTRYTIKAGAITQRSAPLNNVLAWSGH